MDYTSFSNNGEISPRAIEKKWWMQDEVNRPAAIFGIVKYLQNYQSLRTTQLLTSTRLYGGLSLMGLNGLTYSKLAAVTSASTSRLTYNVCQSAVDTAQAKMAKNKPKPLFLTSGGDYKLQRKAKKLTKFVEGVFYENKAYQLGAQVFKDAEVWGTGILHVYECNKRIVYERVICNEIIVDDVEAFYGQPRSLYRTKNIDRSILLDLFPDEESAIKDANQARPDDLGAYPSTSDELQVIEAWHKPSGPDAKDGKHSISIYGKELFSEEWDRDYFPFVFFHWNKKQFGFWGQSLVEQIQPIQLEINKLLWVLQRSYHLAGSFKILLENGSKIVKEHMNNDIGAIISYTGTPPQYVTPPIVQPELYPHLQELTNRAYELAGISQLSATSKKPEGLNSGKALREYNDIESDRFMIVGQNYEEFFVQTAQLTVAVAKHAFGSGSYKVKAPGKKFIETIDWKDVQMKEDEYVLKIYPVSALSDNPSERLDDVQELMQAGIVDPDTGRRLLDYPDLEAEEGLANAELDYLHETFDKMVDEGLYTPPEPYDNLQLARKLALEYYAKGKCSGLEEEKLNQFRTFLSQIDSIEQAAMPPAPPQGAPGPQAPATNGGPSLGAPAQPPVSNILPFSGGQ